MNFTIFDVEKLLHKSPMNAIEIYYSDNCNNSGCKHHNGNIKTEGEDSPFNKIHPWCLELFFNDNVVLVNKAVEEHDIGDNNLNAVEFAKFSERFEN